MISSVEALLFAVGSEGLSKEELLDILNISEEEFKVIIKNMKYYAIKFNE